MKSYMEIRKTGESTFKKLRVLFGTGSYPHTRVQPRTSRRTLAGSLNQQFGTSFRRWSGIFKVKYTEDTGYATLADLQEWMVGSTAAAHLLDLRPINVLWVASVNADIYFSEHVCNFATAPITYAAGMVVEFTDGATVHQSITLATQAGTNSEWTYNDNLGDTQIGGPTFPVYVFDPTAYVSASFDCDFDPQPQVPYAEGEEAFYYVQFVLEER